VVKSKEQALKGLMNLNNFNLKGKTALITGAAGLLGVEHATALLSIGASVVLTDVNKHALDLAKKKLEVDFPVSRIVTKVMDVSDRDNIIQVLNTLKKDKISVNILVNNAAIDPKVDAKNNLLEKSRLENFSIEDWNLQISVGLTGAFLCSQIFGSEMAKNGDGGVILNIASDLSILSPDQRLYKKAGLDEDMQPVKPITYSVVKAGLIGLTRYLATYWTHRGIRCNALSPGGVMNGQSDDFVSRLTELIPMGRMAYPEEYRSAVQFLCSNASSYMNGQNLVLDGGRSIW
jgi:NAD(P)-dependent dehydrogenase (short-subunit alcohol dehydrogenase family)